MAVPAELTRTVKKSDIPDAVTYGDALKLWAEDRQNIDVLNGQMVAIKGLLADEE